METGKRWPRTCLASCSRRRSIYGCILVLIVLLGIVLMVRRIRTIEKETQEWLVLADPQKHSTDGYKIAEGPPGQQGHPEQRGPLEQLGPHQQPGPRTSHTCPETLDDLASSGARIMTANELDVFGPKNYMILKSADFLPTFRSPCWLQEASTKKGGNTSAPQVALRCLPAVMLPGMPKCGSSTLYGQLRKHPDFRATKKEPHYWAWKFPSMPFSEYSQLIGSDGLLSQCTNTSDGVPYHQGLTLDASQSTLIEVKHWRRLPTRDDPNATASIATALGRLHPDMKSVVILRDPVDRLYSDYMYFNRTDVRWSVADFHKLSRRIIDMYQRCIGTDTARACANQLTYLHPRVDIGMYHMYVEDWLQAFPLEQVHFLRLEDYSKDPALYINRIFNFLDIDPIPIKEPSIIRNRRPSSHKAIGVMRNETRTLLQRFYAPFNRQLAKLLDNDMYLWGYGEQ